MTSEIMTAGSLWHRWDPHVHLPGTVLNDQFKLMDVAAALDRLAAQDPAIVAVGVTDYCTTASFRRAALARSEGAGDGIELLFPNVELRLDNATSQNHGVNVHLICGPDNVDRLDEFLAGLEFSFGETTYRCERQSLERLGRAFTDDQRLSADAAFRTGVEQFKVTFEALRKAIRADKWARNSLLVAVAGGEGDGSSGLRNPAGSFVARRQSIESLADVIFSANPKQAEFWSGRGPASVEELEQTYGGQKLCLHGSDAHGEDRLGRPVDDRYTWLKGEVCFDTLKLACVTPETRGHIGSVSPALGTEHGRIVRLSVPSADWFVDETVPVNPGLVAIIGPRGSGKTAFADLLAAGAGSSEPFDNVDSFIRRAGRLLLDTSVAVEWSHDEVTICDIGSGPAGDEFLRPVRYLSQQFVDRLCASDGISDDLLDEIERVVFEAWPMDQRQGATDFRQLLNIRLGSSNQRQASELEAVLELSDRINEAAGLKRALPERTKERDAKAKELADVQRKIQDLTGKADAESTKRLTIVGNALQERSQEVQRLDRSATALSALRGRVETARSTTFPGFVEKLRNEHEHAGLTGEEWDAFEVEFSGHVDSILSDATVRVEVARNAIAGGPEAPDAAGLDALTPEDLRSRTVAALKSGSPDPRVGG
jgi:hypothetical protein